MQSIGDVQLKCGARDVVSGNQIHDTHILSCPSQKRLQSFKDSSHSCLQTYICLTISVKYLKCENKYSLTNISLI